MVRQIKTPGISLSSYDILSNLQVKKKSHLENLNGVNKFEETSVRDIDLNIRTDGIRKQSREK